MTFQIRVQQFDVQITNDNYYISTKIQSTFNVLFYDQVRVNKVIILLLKLVYSYYSLSSCQQVVSMFQAMFPDTTVVSRIRWDKAHH